MKLHKIESFSLLFFCLFIFSSFNRINQRKFLESIGFKYIHVGRLSNTNNEETLQSFFIFETEVSNKEYQIFLTDLRKEGRIEDYKIAKVDSTAWSKILNFSAPYVNYYHRDSLYQNYPVVNISREAAEIYCLWLKKRCNKFGLNIQIRLPTKNEWVYAAKGKIKNAIYSNKKNILIDKKGYSYCLFKGTLSCDGTEDEHFMGPVKTAIRNGFGLYNMCGNVAEMIMGGGTKGGSYNSDAEHVKIEGEDEYSDITEASPYIGFRPVAIIN